MYTKYSFVITANYNIKINIKIFWNKICQHLGVTKVLFKASNGASKDKLTAGIWDSWPSALKLVSWLSTALDNWDRCDSWLLLDSCDKCDSWLLLDSCDKCANCVELDSMLLMVACDSFVELLNSCICCSLVAARSSFDFWLVDRFNAVFSLVGSCEAVSFFLSGVGVTGFGAGFLVLSFDSGLEGRGSFS